MEFSTKALAAYRAEIAAAKMTCACELTKPCRPQCSCANGLLSGGCDRCASYGSAEQRQAAAERIADQEARCREAVALLREVYTYGESSSRQIDRALALLALKDGKS